MMMMERTISQTMYDGLASNSGTEERVRKYQQIKEIVKKGEEDVGQGLEFL